MLVWHWHYKNHLMQTSNKRTPYGQTTAGPYQSISANLNQVHRPCCAPAFVLTNRSWSGYRFLAVHMRGLYANLLPPAVTLAVGQEFSMLGWRRQGGNAWHVFFMFASVTWHGSSVCVVSPLVPCLGVWLCLHEWVVCLCVRALLFEWLCLCVFTPLCDLWRWTCRIARSGRIRWPVARVQLPAWGPIRIRPGATRSLRPASLMPPVYSYYINTPIYPLYHWYFLPPSNRHRAS